MRVVKADHLEFINQNQNSIFFDVLFADENDNFLNPARVVLSSNGRVMCSKYQELCTKYNDEIYVQILKKIKLKRLVDGRLKEFHVPDKFKDAVEKTEHPVNLPS